MFHFSLAKKKIAYYFDLGKAHDDCDCNNGKAKEIESKIQFTEKAQRLHSSL